MILTLHPSFARTLGPVMRWGPEPSVGAAARDRRPRVQVTEAEAECCEIHVCSIRCYQLSQSYNLSASKSWVDIEVLDGEI